jgi:redox-sensitive bicupin YhaK (pirin superfamily)
MPRRSPQGNIYGFQLWVNLPAARKMETPRYQEVSSGTIPVIRREGIAIRVVAGEVDGVAGPVAEIAANPLYLDVQLEPGASFAQPIPAGHTGIAYVYHGEGEFGLNEDGAGQVVEAVRMVVLGDGDELRVQASPASPVHFMLIAGAPFREPIVPYGPFVMNTEDEIRQALNDLRNGTFIRA